MLQRLHIQNYAIIDELSVDFAGGLNIITGETGAGKSILMGALNLILGQRADSSVLMDAQKKCTVEGVFSLSQNQFILDFFNRHDLDIEAEVVIRREINANGKSRSFINDTPVNLSQVKQLSVHLVDLHQQFDTLDINTEEFQLAVLDAMAQNHTQLEQHGKLFQEYTTVRHELLALQEAQDKANKELDYHRFLFEELEALNLKENELEQLDAELKMLSDAENIKQQLSAIYFVLNNTDQPLVQQVKSLHQKLKPLQEYHLSIGALAERLLGVTIEMKDIAEDLEAIESNIRYDAERIQVVNDRIAAGYKLLKKHGVNSTSALLKIQEELQQNLNSYSNAEVQLALLEETTSRLLAACNESSTILTDRRKSVVDDFVKKVNALLVQVGMPNARLKINITPAPLRETGADRIDFLFDANKSGKFKALGKVASGGELSRLMLSMKSLVASRLELPTLIFDEIDTGISGEAARQVGIIMKALAEHHQLIAITHQPQIAAKASTHFFVYKEIQNDKIKTAIRTLNTNERIVTIAQMLSGEKPSAAALENAREMVSN